MWITRRAPWLTLMLLLVATRAGAQGLIPGPGESGHDPALLEKARRADRQFHVFNASQFGVALEAVIPDPADRALIADYMAQEAELDFAAFTAQRGTPRTVEQVIAAFGDHGDLGIFGGMPAAADAFRYAVLRDARGAAVDPSALAEARQDLLDAIEAFHVYAEITGAPGTVPRGIRLRTEPGDPPEPVPASCSPPHERGRSVWREDQSGRHPDFLFIDNASKDQVIGYVLALGVFWDVVAEDPAIPEQVKLHLQNEARAMGAALRTPVEVRPGVAIDLVITDMNGCPTRFHDLNPREVLLDSSNPLVFSETASTQNGFNAAAALGIIRTLYHVSGDPALARYYYDELIGRRSYPSVVQSGAGRLRSIFANACVGGTCAVTNFSNVNMAFVSIYGALRYESDPAVLAAMQQILRDDLWTGPKPHMGSEIQQAYFNLIWAAFRPGGVDAAQAANAAAQLVAFPGAPYFESEVINCDPGELAARSCVGIDGVTALSIDDTPMRGGGPAATAPVPIAIRPPGGFEWVRDPRRVNVDGGLRMFSGGDFRIAYWMGRYLRGSGNNTSPIARNADGTGGPRPPPPPMDAGVAPGPDASTPAGADAAAPIADAGIAAEDRPVTSGGDAGASLADAGSSDDDAGFARTDATTAGVDAGAMRSDAAPPDDPPASPDSCSCATGGAGTRDASRAPPLLALILVLVLRAAQRRHAPVVR